jgi:hypothetical protein
MRESENGPSSNSDSSPRLFENPKFQAYAVPIALELMLTAIDQCRYMLQNLQPEKAFSSSTTTTGQGENLLPAREREVLDRAIASFWDDVESRARRELGLDEEDSEEGEWIYPLAQETVATLLDLRIQKIKERSRA